MKDTGLTGRLFTHARNLFSFMNIFSLDVVAGAMLSSAFALSLLDVRTTEHYWMVLGISVWIIYTADHLVDAYRLGDTSHTGRHRFVYRHFRQLTFLILLFLIVDLWMVVTYLGVRILVFGMVSGAFVMAYLLLLHLSRGRRWAILQKELIVSLVYTAGVWGYALLEPGTRLGPAHAAMPALFLLLALMNTLVLSYHEHGADVADRHQTIAVVFGKKAAFSLVRLLGVVVTLTSVVLVFYSRSGSMRMASVIYVLMAVSMMVLVSCAVFSRHRLLTRVLTEAVFWFPGLFLLFQG